MSTKSKLILASGSPRRREVLGYFYNNINILRVPGFKEPEWEKGENPNDYIARCVGAKWNAAEKHFAGDGLLLVADTSVVLGPKVLGKPKDFDDAVAMLESLSGRTHKVITGVIWGNSLQSSGLRTFESRVSFKKINKKQILNYVRTGDPLDKAGAYGFQGQAIQFVDRVDGSYYTIMGLPAWPLFQEIEAWAGKKF